MPVARELDNNGADIYSAEVRELTSRLIIGRTKRQIEHRRVFVDTARIARGPAERFRESFNRYVALVREGLVASDVAETQRAMRKAVSGDPDELVRLRLPRNEAMALLEFMINGIRDDFASSTEHGLDGYLSVRIRHGALAGHLRGPLEKLHLVTRREAGKISYKQNSHWQTRLAAATPEVCIRIDQRLAAFFWRD